MRETEYTDRAIHELAKLPAKDAKRIMGKINQYARAPEELANNVIPLTNQDGKRLRVGNYRVLFNEDDKVVRVYRVRKRSEAYRD